MITKLVDYLSPLISNKTSLLLDDGVLPLKEALLKIASYNKQSSILVVVDSNLKIEEWTKASKGFNIELVILEDLKTYVYCGYNIILDLEPVEYQEDVIEEVKDELPSFIWVIGKERAEYVPVMGALGELFKVIDIDVTDIMEDVDVLLVKEELPDDLEYELIEFYTGIPVNTNSESYKEFIPAMSKNCINYLKATSRDKYDFLLRRYEMYRDLWIKTDKSNASTNFIKTNFINIGKEIRAHLTWYRCNTIVEIINDYIFYHGYKVLIVGNELTKDFTLNNRRYAHVTEAELAITDPKAYYDFLSSQLDILSVEVVPSKDIIDEADIIIYNDASTKTVDNLKALCKLSENPIVVPYFDKTRDDTYISKVKEAISCKEIEKDDITALL